MVVRVLDSRQITGHSDEESGAGREREVQVCGHIIVKGICSDFLCGLVGIYKDLCISSGSKLSFKQRSRYW